MRWIKSTKKGLLLAALLLSGFAGAFEAAWMTEGSLGTVGGFNPNRKAEDNLKSSGAEANFYFTPIFGWKDSPWLILTAYDMEYSGVNTVLKVEEDIFVFASRLTNTLELGGAYRTQGGSRWTVKTFAETFQATETVDEKFGAGLYDYLDKGAKISYSGMFQEERPLELGVGLKSTDRTYPNYITLDPTQKKEKDSKITKFYVDLSKDWKNKSNFISSLRWSVQDENFPEAYVIDETGTTNSASALRRDMVNSIDLDLNFQKGKHSWGFGYGLEARSSNFNYLDSNQFLYMENYNDYGEHAVKLNYAYQFEGPWAWNFFKEPRLSADIRSSTRLYKTRLARNSQGAYDEPAPLQIDSQYSLAFGFDSPVSAHWSVNADLAYQALRSNNKDESSSLFNYNFGTLRLGASFNY